MAGHSPQKHSVKNTKIDKLTSRANKAKFNYQILKKEVVIGNY